MIRKSLFVLLWGSSALVTPGFAGDDVCEFTSQTFENTKGYVSEIKNYSKQTAVYAEEKRICSVKFMAKLGKKWVETHGFYVFGPDETETSACKKAVEKGKVRAVKHEYGSEIEYVAEQRCIAKPEVKVVEKRILVDRKSGRVVTPNEGSGSFVCLAMSIFAPAGYNNPRCHAYVDNNNPYVQPGAPRVPHNY